MRSPTTPLSLLIVDDSKVIRNRIARLVANPQLPPISICGLAGNGEIAVKMAKENRPDLVTMDLTMPNMDGKASHGFLHKPFTDTELLDSLLELIG